MEHRPEVPQDTTLCESDRPEPSSAAGEDTARSQRTAEAPPPWQAGQTQLQFSTGLSMQPSRL
eukprot:12406860-Alexandrium_andersonii.AAC.1